MQKRRGMNEKQSSFRRCPPWKLLLPVIFTLAARCDADWIDPDTPEKGRTTKPLTVGDDREYELVSRSMSKAGGESAEGQRRVSFFLESNCRFSLTSLNETEEHFTTALILVGRRSIRTTVSELKHSTMSLSQTSSLINMRHVFRHQRGTTLLQ